MEYDWSSKQPNCITDMGMTVDGEPFLHCPTWVKKNLRYSGPCLMQAFDSPELHTCLVWFPPFKIILN